VRRGLRGMESDAGGANLKEGGSCCGACSMRPRQLSLRMVRCFPFASWSCPRLGVAMMVSLLWEGGIGKDKLCWIVWEVQVQEELLCRSRQHSDFIALQT
jgi:hypothetical protein